MMGRSGSGKSTLVRTMTMLEIPTSGEVFLNGERLSASPLDSLGPWPRITVVFQQVFLWPHLTLYENTTLPARLRALDIERLRSISADLDMSECLQRYPNEVSIGQRQRAALVRALLLKPSYLFVDELTSAQDIEQVARILAILLREVNDGTALLVVTHHIEFARRLLANSSHPRFAFMEAGEVVEAGGAECLEHPKTDKLAAFLATIRSVS